MPPRGNGFEPRVHGNDIHLKLDTATTKSLCSRRHDVASALILCGLPMSRA
jgi:hypothetical protein